MVKAAVDGFSDVFECVVHPAHVPFHAEAKPADIGRPGNLGPGGGFFGQCQRARKFVMDDFVEQLEEGDSFQIFLPPYLLGIHSPGLRE